MIHELTSEVIDHLLISQLFGRLGCAAEGQVLVQPVTYMYDGQSIYGETHEGTLTRLLWTNPSMCFEVDELAGLASYQSVLIQGVYEELQGNERLFIERQLGPGRAAPGIESGLNNPEFLDPSPIVVYRIHIMNKTGRSATKDG